MALVYSRDSVARPLAVLAHVLDARGAFLTLTVQGVGGSKRATSLDKVEAFAFQPQKVSQQSSVESECQDVENMSEQSWQKVTGESQPLPEAEQMDLGHVTADSSNSSEEQDSRSPVVGHYVISVPEDKALWKNLNSKMFHLSSVDHVKVLLCGRRITSSFHRHEGSVRFDSAKCKQCFRLKDS